MRVLLLTNEGKWANRVEFDGDLFLIGFRELLGDDAVDFPKREYLYKQHSVKQKCNLYGRGFTLLTEPLRDIKNRSHEGKFDHVIYLGSRCLRYPKLQQRAGGVYYEVRHDARTAHKQLTALPMRTTKQLPEESPIFRFEGGRVRNLFEEHKDWSALPLGIPERNIMSISFSGKTQIHQNGVPKEGGKQSKYLWRNEENYYSDMRRSWFGINCRKQRWDALRPYEMLATGTCLVFLNYDRKPVRTAPAKLPCFSIRHKDEIFSLYNRLITKGKPSVEYQDMVYRQREWLLRHGTTKQVARRVLERIST